MGKHVSDWLRRVSNGWVALGALLIFLLFSVLVLPQQATKAERETGSSASPDTSFVYSASDLYQIADSYGEQGREAYVSARFTFDLIWPLVYTLFLVTAISWVFDHVFAPESPWQRANLAPLLAALFDYLENVSTSVVMLRYPEHTSVVDILAPIFTLLKWGFLGASFVLLIVGVLVAGWRWANRRAPGTGSASNDQ